MSLSAFCLDNRGIFKSVRCCPTVTKHIRTQTNIFVLDSSSGNLICYPDIDVSTAAQTANITKQIHTVYILSKIIHPTLKKTAYSTFTLKIAHFPKMSKK